MEEQKRLEKNKREKERYYENHEAKKAYARERYHETREESLQRNKKWREENRERTNELNREAYQRNKEWYNERRRKMLKDHPEINRARSLVNKHIREERMDRPKFCEKCGKECFTYAHHEDYSKSLEVIFLCRKCHTLIHRQ